MAKHDGVMPNIIRRMNRAQVLNRILTDAENTRVSIANSMNLTKTTLTNIVSEMKSVGILSESTDLTPRDISNKTGRKSITLRLSEDAPLICGILILRQRLCAILGTMDGRIIHRITQPVVEGLTIEILRRMLASIFRDAMAAARQPVFAVSIASLGPLDCKRGIMLRPTNFYAEEVDFDLLGFFRNLTDLPVFITHDAAAAALAENLYGAAHNSEDFMFLSLEGGIGAGFYLDGRLYKGPFGQNGEIGHTSIRFDGPQCKCGNRGCLELYANPQTLRHSAERFYSFQPHHRIYSESIDIFSIIRMADEGDTLCHELVKEYCQYLAHALCSAITLLNIREIYVGTPVESKNHVFETTLNDALSQRLYLWMKTGDKHVQHSYFGIDSTLYGTIAAVMEMVFEGELFPGETVSEDE